MFTSPKPHVRKKGVSYPFNSYTHDHMAKRAKAAIFLTFPWFICPVQNLYQVHNPPLHMSSYEYEYEYDQPHFFNSIQILKEGLKSFSSALFPSFLSFFLPPSSFFFHLFSSFFPFLYLPLSTFTYPRTLK